MTASYFAALEHCGVSSRIEIKLRVAIIRSRGVSSTIGARV